MKKTIIALGLMVLSGCATFDEPRIQQSANQTYVINNKPLAERGEIKWSDYYKGLYDTVNTEPRPTKGEFLLIVNDLIDSALSYENNKITKDEFASIRRRSGAMVEKINDDYEMKMQEIEAFKPAPKPKPQVVVIEKEKQYDYQLPIPKTTNCYRNGNNTTCTTY